MKHYSTGSYCDLTMPPIKSDIIKTSYFSNTSFSTLAPCQFKIQILLLSYEALNDQAPPNLEDLIVPNNPIRANCSQRAGRLVAPRVDKCSIRGRAFSLEAVRVGSGDSWRYSIVSSIPLPSLPICLFHLPRAVKADAHHLHLPKAASLSCLDLTWV